MPLYITVLGVAEAFKVPVAKRVEVVPAISKDEEMSLIHADAELPPVISFVVLTVPWLVTVTPLAMAMTGEIERFELLGIFLSVVILIVPEPVKLPVVMVGVSDPPTRPVPLPLSVNVFAPIARVPLFVKLPDKVVFPEMFTVVPEPMVKSPVNDGKEAIVEEPVPDVVTSLSVAPNTLKLPLLLVLNKLVTVRTPVEGARLPPA